MVALTQVPHVPHTAVMRDDLAVPVLRIPVMLLLDDGSRRGVTIFLSSGRTLEDFVESQEMFVPAQDGERIRLYARKSIACISVSLGDVERVSTEMDAGMAFRKRHVEITTAAGSTIRGELRYIPSHEFVRTIDYLNEAEATVAVFGNDAVHYVVKAHVRSVDET